MARGYSGRSVRCLPAPPVSTQNTWLPLTTCVSGKVKSLSRQVPLFVVATVVLQPTARRHPYGLVALAFAAGGLLALSRPGRWLPMKALGGALLAPLLSPKKR